MVARKPKTLKEEVGRRFRRTINSKRRARVANPKPYREMWARKKSPNPNEEHVVGKP